MGLNKERQWKGLEIMEKDSCSPTCPVPAAAIGLQILPLLIGDMQKREKVVSRIIYKKGLIEIDR